MDGLFRKGQLVSAALYSLGHGGNDAQKTIGIIWMLLIAAGISKSGESVPSWVIFGCYISMGLGTMFGGWRIVKTMGQKITKLKPVGGFCAETSGAITLFLATALGVLLALAWPVGVCSFLTWLLLDMQVWISEYVGWSDLWTDITKRPYITIGMLALVLMVAGYAVVPGLLLPSDVAFLREYLEANLSDAPQPLRVEPDELDAHFTRLPARYFEVHTAREIANDIQLAHRFMRRTIDSEGEEALEPQAFFATTFQ